MAKKLVVDLRMLAVAALAPTLALAAAPATAMDMVALDSGNRLARFSDKNMKAAQWVTIRGASANIVGIDVRPADGKLYGLAADGGVYRIDAMTGEAMQVSKLNVAAAPDATVIDFNPVADRMRVLTSGGRSLRINVENGETAEDGKLNFANGDRNSGGTPWVTAGGYTNSMAGAKSTALYEIDSKVRSILIQDPPNAGTLKTKAVLQKPPQNLRGLDIVSDTSGRHWGYAVSGATVYRIDIASAQMVTVGKIGRGDGRFIDIAVIPTP